MNDVTLEDSPPPPAGALVGVGSTPTNDVVESVIEHFEAPLPHSGAVTEKRIGSQSEQSGPM